MEFDDTLAMRGCIATFESMDMICPEGGICSCPNRGKSELSTLLVSSKSDDSRDIISQSSLPELRAVANDMGTAKAPPLVANDCINFRTRGVSTTRHPAGSCFICAWD